MNFVQPIRSKEKLEQMKEELKKRGTRDYLLFYTGINTGLRVSDVVALNYNDVRDNYGNMRSHISITEKKTGKIKKFPICNGLYDELEKYTKFMKPGEYLFKSQIDSNQPITTTQAYRILKHTASIVGLEEVGTHSMRKTFAFWHYRQYHDVALLQTIFNHSSPSITLRYIGINQDEIDRSYYNFSL